MTIYGKSTDSGMSDGEGMDEIAEPRGGGGE